MRQFVSACNEIPEVPLFGSSAFELVHEAHIETCLSCGAPTHQLAREDLTAELSPPPIDYAAEVDAPEIELATSEPHLPERSEVGLDPSQPQERRSDSH